MNKYKFQIFIEELVNTILTILKIFLFSKYFVKIKSCENRNNECVILGNGPSLTDSIENKRHTLSGKDIFCVNRFATSDYFDVIKPVFYIITAPEYWRDNVDDQWKRRAEELLQTIKEKTNWQMSLLLPVESAKYNKIQNIISGNKNITISYYNTTPVEGFRCSSHFFFNFNLGMPRPHNVLISSIFLAIRMNYKKIYLLGADHSWLSEIRVTDSNDVLVNQKHFYDKDSSEPKPMQKAGRGKRKLHEVLVKFVYAFKGYFVLEEYSIYRQSKIYNATPNSFIDAFERIELK